MVMVDVDSPERSAAVVSILIHASHEEKVWKLTGPHGVVYRRHQYHSPDNFTDHSYFPRTPDMDHMNVATLATTLRERFQPYLQDGDLLHGVTEMELVRGLQGEPQVHTSRSAFHSGCVIFLATNQPRRLVAVNP